MSKRIRIVKKKKTTFDRFECYRHKRMGRSWRRPRGLHSKQRKDYRAKGAHPEAGFGAPKAVRGFHPSGYREALVFTPAELSTIDPATTAVRIGATVGGAKRSVIQNKAAELGIKILNPKEAKVAVTPAAKPAVEVKADE